MGGVYFFTFCFELHFRLVGRGNLLSELNLCFLTNAMARLDGTRYFRSRVGCSDAIEINEVRVLMITLKSDLAAAALAVFLALGISLPLIPSPTCQCDRQNSSRLEFFTTIAKSRGLRAAGETKSSHLIHQGDQIHIHSHCIRFRNLFRGEILLRVLSCSDRIHAI